MAERWQSARWDSLCFQFPNAYIRLPGLAYDGNDPEGFAHYTAIAAFLENYCRQIAAPVRIGSEVVRLGHSSTNDRYFVETTDDQITARNVVIATGPFQRSHVPEFARFFPPDLYQVDAVHSRNPDELPPGAVLVVGSGASGCQICEELYQSGRTVFLAVSRHKRVPRRYLGKDMIWWFEKMGRFDVRVDSFPGRRYPPSTVVTGVGGGHDVDVRHFARDGVQVVGHLKGVADGTLSIEPNANQILDDADQACREFISIAHELAPGLGMNPPESAEDLHFRDTRVGELRSLNMRKANLRSAVWATGYRFNYNWLDLPILDENGTPIQDRGVTPCPGVYFLGLHWMHTFKSGILPYIGEDAAYLVKCIERRPQ